MIRVPRITGFPEQMAGLISIRFIASIVLDHHSLAYLPENAVIMEEVSTHLEPQTRSLWLRPIRIGPRSRVDVRGDGSCGVPMAAG